MGLFNDIGDSLFGSNDKKNPADAAMPYYQQIPDMEKGYYNPFIQRGNDAYNKFNPIYSEMSSDPTGFINKIMSQYQSSPGFNYQKDQALKAAGNSAAAGGMRGSLGDIDQQAHITDSLTSNDMQKWLENVLGTQKTGLTGEQSLYNTGFDASHDLSGDLSNVYGTEGSLAFQGQANQNKSQSDIMEGLMKMLGSVGGWATSGGGSIGANLLSKFF